MNLTHRWKITLLLAKLRSVLACDAIQQPIHYKTFSIKKIVLRVYNNIPTPPKIKQTKYKNKENIKKELFIN